MDLYIYQQESLFSNKSFLTPKTIGYVMREYSMTVDTQLDWDFAEFIMSKFSNNQIKHQFIQYVRKKFFNNIFFYN